MPTESDPIFKSHDYAVLFNDNGTVAFSRMSLDEAILLSKKPGVIISKLIKLRDDFQEETEVSLKLLREKPR